MGNAEAEVPSAASDYGECTTEAEAGILRGAQNRATVTHFVLLG